MFPKRCVYFYNVVLFFLIFGTLDRGQHVKAKCPERKEILFLVLSYLILVCKILLDGGNFCSNKINSFLSLVLLENVILRYVIVCYCYFQFHF